MHPLQAPTDAELASISCNLIFWVLTRRFPLSRNTAMMSYRVSAVGLATVPSILLALLASISMLAAEDPTRPLNHPEADATTAGHRFLCTDYTQGKVFIVARDGKVEWEYPAPSCNDVWALPNGNFLFNTGHGVREVTLGKQVVLDYQSPSEIYACQRLANGNTFIGECNSGRLLEVDPAGKVAKEVRLLPEGKDGGHLYMRNARRLDNGNYLVAHYGEEVVREYDSQGKVIREIPARGGPHSVVRLPNGNTLIACADRQGGPRVFEVDPAGKTVWQVQAGDLPGIGLKFMAGLHRLPNGNTVMANWLGHNQFGKAPHLIEITPDKHVVWTFSDHQTMRTVSSVQLLDQADTPNAPRVLH